MRFASEVSEDRGSEAFFSPGHASKHDRSSTAQYMSAENRRRMHVVLVFSALAPWLITMTVLSVFLYLSHHHTSWVWSFTCFCFIASAAICILPLVRGRRPLAMLGLLLMAGCIYGTALGVFLNHMYMRRYWAIRDASAFAGVDPLTDGRQAAMEDAGQLSFVQDTFVDDRRTLGYIRGGKIYCVAPVVRAPTVSNNISFWASGTACCEQRSNFLCKSGEPPASGSYVAVRVHDAADEFYAAVQEAVAVYRLEKADASATHILISVSESEDLQDGLQAQAHRVAYLAGWVSFMFYLTVSLLFVKKILVAMYSAP